jgi:hypothetical protein
MRRLGQVHEKHTGRILLASHVDVLVLLPDGLLVDFTDAGFGNGIDKQDRLRKLPLGEFLAASHYNAGYADS